MDKNIQKYIKYKTKYLELKQSGGMFNLFRSTSTSKSNLEIFNDKSKLAKDDMKCSNLEYYFNINTKNNLIDNLKSDNSNFDISKLNNFSNLITIATNNIQILFDTTGRNLDNKTNSENLIKGYEKHIKDYINTHLNGIKNKEILIELLEKYFVCAQHKVKVRQIAIPNSNVIQELPKYN